MAGQVSWAELKLPGNSASISYDARITGISSSSGIGFGADTFGSATFTTGTPAAITYDVRITGQNTSAVSYNARITSQASTSRTLDTRITAVAPTLVVFEARATGQATSFRVQDARITSGNASSISYAAAITAQAQPVLVIDARITSANVTAVSYDVRVTGRATTAIQTDARITGQNVTSVTYTASITVQNTTSVAYDVRVTGQSAVAQIRTQDVRGTGQATAFASFSADVIGQLSSNAVYSARTTGQATTTTATDVRTTGQASTNSSFAVFVTGIAPATSIAFNAAIAGNVVSTTQYGAFITGRVAPQTSSPIADNLTGSWHDAPLYQKIDEASLDVTDYIESGPSPSVVDISEVQLGAMFDPGLSNDHVVRYAYSKDTLSGDRINLTVRLMQGGIEIASWTHTDIPVAIQLASQTLTTVQANSISNYSDLRLRFEAVVG